MVALGIAPEVRKRHAKAYVWVRPIETDGFKTPGTNVNGGERSDVRVLTEEARHELMKLNRQWLEDHPPPADD